MRRISAPRLARVVAATIAIALASTMLSFTPTVAAEPAAAGALDGETVASPDGSIGATIAVVDGRLTYEVVRDENTVVVAPSGLGLTLDRPEVDLTSGMTVTSVDRRSEDETWTPAWGTDARVRNHFNELVVHAVHEDSGTELDVTIRVFDDGFGLRYTFPQQADLGEFDVTEESTGFAVPENATAYYLRAGTDNNADERHYITAPVASVQTAQTPITLAVGDDLVMSVHEADLTDYPSMTMARDDAGLVSSLIALPDGNKAVLDVTDESFSTPWRTITVGRGAKDLANSHLVANLNPPCAICDVDSDDDGQDDTTDWIVPSTYTGVWWELQRRDTTWNAGPSHGATTQRVKEYIDLAAEAGAKAVLAEGWNENAGGSWTGQDFLTPMEDFDLPEVLAYAEANDVGFVAHNETRGYVDYYDEHLEEIFSQYEEWGIHSIKTGYATRFLLGGVQRSHADQEAVRHFRRVIEVAARHQITINAHETIKPTGLERTFPNMMTGENVAGMEQQNYKGPNGNPPEQATILPFTRWIGGPADYTPGIVNVTWDPGNLNTRVQTTTATQLALYTTFFSPLQMLADTPENYADQPTAFAYLKDMPATWDESSVIDAQIGDYVLTARRSGDAWYLGAVTDENDRTLSVPLDFLEPGTAYVADVFADAADASWKGNPTAVDRTRTIVDSTDTLAASMVAAGGQAARFTPATPEQIEELPTFEETTLSMDGAPAASYDPRSGTVTVTADIVNDGSGVASAYLYLDGDRVDSTRTRLDGQSRATATVDIPADSIPYRSSYSIGVGDGASAPSSSVDAALLPYPDQDFVDAVADVTGSAGLDDDVARRIERLVSGAVEAAAAGDLPAVNLKMQSIRLLVLSAGPTRVAPEAFAALDDLVTPWLGEPAGLMDAMARIRAIEEASDVAADTALQWRDLAAAAARAAIRGDDETQAASLDTLAAALAGAADVAGVSDLRALVEQQRSARRLLETENGTLSGGTGVSTEHAGYTGTGFVKNLTSVGACVEVTATDVRAGDYLVGVRFANGMVVEPLDRQLTIAVGEQESTVDFPNQGQDSQRWKRWADTATTRATVQPGDTVALCYRDGDTGNINADSISLLPDPGVAVRPGETVLPSVDASLDPASPTGENGWWTGPVDVSVVAGGADDAEPQVRVDDGPWNPVDGTVRVDGDGEHEVFARAVTDDETSPQQRLAFKIDATTPVSRAVVDEATRTVAVRAADETSGLARIEVRRFGAEDFEVYDAPFTVNDDEETMDVRAVDRAGNVEDAYQVTVPAAESELAETSTTASLDEDEIAYGSDLLVDVDVSSADGEPTGWVEVRDRETVLARAQLTAGSASVAVPGLDVGEHDLTVAYVGDATFASSSTQVNAVVVTATSTTTLELPRSVTAGDTADALVTVDAGEATANGPVELRSGSDVVAEGDLIGGRATVPVPADLLRRVGSIQLQATFAGSERVAGSESEEVTVTVVAGALATVEVEAPASTVPQGGSLTFTAYGFDAFGNELGDLTDAVEFTSDVPTDVVDGSTVTFPDASPHTITATHAEPEVSGSLTIEVRAVGDTGGDSGDDDSSGDDHSGDGTGSGSAGSGGSSEEDGLIPDTGGPSLLLLLLAAALTVGGGVLVRRQRS